MVIAISQVIPPVWISNRVCRKPLAVLGLVVPEEERITKAVHHWLAGEECVPVGAGMALPPGPELPVQKVDHGVGLLPRLVEEREVLGEADVHGRAGRVQDHRPAVGVGGVA